MKKSFLILPAMIALLSFSENNNDPLDKVSSDGPLLAQQDPPRDSGGFGSSKNAGVGGGVSGGVHSRPRDSGGFGSSKNAGVGGGVSGGVHSRPRDSGGFGSSKNAGVGGGVN